MGPLTFEARLFHFGNILGTCDVSIPSGSPFIDASLSFFAQTDLLKGLAKSVCYNSVIPLLFTKSTSWNTPSLLLLLLERPIWSKVVFYKSVATSDSKAL